MTQEKDIVTLSPQTSAEIEAEAETRMEEVFDQLMFLLRSAPVGQIIEKAALGPTFIRDLRRKGRSRNLGLRNLVKILLAMNVEPSVFLTRTLGKSPQNEIAEENMTRRTFDDPDLREALSGSKTPPEVLLARKEKC